MIKHGKEQYVLQCWSPRPGNVHVEAEAQMPAAMGLKKRLEKDSF